MASRQQVQQQHYPSSAGGVGQDASHEATVSASTDHNMVEMLGHGSPSTLVSPNSPSSLKRKALEGDHVDIESSAGTQSSTVSEHAAKETRHIGWTPSLLRAGPLVGLAALVLAFLLMLASYAILKASDGDTVPNWKYQPTVYLAIFTAISNKALAFATIQGTVISFWLGALRGTTLGQLHRDWGYGLHVYKAMMAGKHFNILALACICTTFVAIDGPLLQRASSVGNKVPNQAVPLNVSITPEVPAYFSGISSWQNWPDPGLGIQDRFLPILHGYASKTPISGAVTGCTGRCRATVRAPALALEYCGSTSEYINYTKPLPKKMWNKILIGCDGLNITERQVFWAAMGTRNGTIDNPAERLELGTAVTDDEVTKTCAGHLNKTICTLVSAIAEYRVTIEDGVINFAESISHPKIISRANNTSLSKEDIKKFDLYDAKMAMINTTLSGMAFGATIMYSYESVSNNEAAGSEALVAGFSTSTGDVSEVPMPTIFTFNFQTNYARWNGGLDCAPAWRDPRDEIMATLNELMFRTGVHAAQIMTEAQLKSMMDDGLEVHTKVQGTPLNPVNVFHSNLNWFVGAAAVNLFSILIILFTFYGWWRLGRHATLSPLEIAKAFDAPLLRNVASNHNGREIAKLEGERNIQYGILNDETETNEETGFLRAEKIVMADEERVHKPIGKRMSLEEYYDIMRERFSKFKLRRRPGQ